MTLYGKFRQRLPRAARLLVFAVLACAALALCSQAQEHQLSPEKRTQIEAAVSKFMSSTHVPGVSVAVVENGEYEWGSGFGLADMENNAPASEHTLYRLASISQSAVADHDAPGDGTSSRHSAL